MTGESSRSPRDDRRRRIALTRRRDLRCSRRARWLGGLAVRPRAGGASSRCCGRARRFAQARRRREDLQGAIRLERRRSLAYDAGSRARRACARRIRAATAGSPTRSTMHAQRLIDALSASAGRLRPRRPRSAQVDRGSPTRAGTRGQQRDPRVRASPWRGRPSPPTTGPRSELGRREAPAAERVDHGQRGPASRRPAPGAAARPVPNAFETGGGALDRRTTVGGACSVASAPGSHPRPRDRADRARTQEAARGRALARQGPARVQGVRLEHRRRRDHDDEDEDEPDRSRPPRPSGKLGKLDPLRSLPRVRIARELLDEIVAHAREDAPNECCGMIAARRRATRCACTGRRTSRPARCATRSTRARSIRVHRRDRGRRVDLGAIYHSHTRSEPYPSQTDIEIALSTAAATGGPGRCT